MENLVGLALSPRARLADSLKHIFFSQPAIVAIVSDGRQPTSLDTLKLVSMETQRVVIASTLDMQPTKLQVYARAWKM